MKQTRVLAAALAVILIAFALSGCGAKYTDRAYSPEAGDYEYYYSGGYAAGDGYYSISNGGYYDEDWDEAPADGWDGGDEGADGTVLDQPSGAPALAEKIIYSADATVETVDFDRTTADVESMVELYGGFFEESTVTGTSYSDAYYNNEVLRSASYIIRVPSSAFQEMTSGLSRLGQVTGMHRYTENVTSRFTDLESHLTALRTEEASLISMMEKAETVSELIEIESRLADVRYEIEYYTSTLRNLQNDVDYSTITLRVQEVRVLSAVVEPQLTYWEQMGQGFNNSLASVGRFFQNAFMAIVTNLPMILFALILLGILAFIVIRGVRKAARRARATAAYPPAPQMPAQPFAPAGAPDVGATAPAERSAETPAREDGAGEDR